MDALDRYERRINRGVVSAKGEAALETPCSRVPKSRLYQQSNPGTALALRIKVSSPPNPSHVLLLKPVYTLLCFSSQYPPVLQFKQEHGVLTILPKPIHYLCPAVLCIARFNHMINLPTALACSNGTAKAGSDAAQKVSRGKPLGDVQRASAKPKYDAEYSRRTEPK